MNTLKFEYLRFENASKSTPLDELAKLAFERSVNILYEDYTEKINGAKGRIVIYFKEDGRISDKFILVDFPPGVPNYAKNISEIINYMI